MKRMEIRASCRSPGIRSVGRAGELLGPDPWEYGLTDANRRNFETLVGYSHDQGLIGRRIELDELFLPVSQGRKRGKFAPETLRA